MPLRRVIFETLVLLSDVFKKRETQFASLFDVVGIGATGLESELAEKIQSGVTRHTLRANTSAHRFPYLFHAL